jgi:hypothetical protein
MNFATINGKPTYVFRVPSLSRRRHPGAPSLAEQIKTAIASARKHGIRVEAPANAPTADTCPECSRIFAKDAGRSLCFACADAYEKRSLEARHKCAEPFLCPYCHKTVGHLFDNQKTCGSIECQRIRNKKRSFEKFESEA